MRIQGIDHVEYYVGDLTTTAGNMCQSFGFRVTGLPVPGGPQSMLLRYGQIHLLLTAPGSDGDRAAQYLGRHGDGVGVIAFRVDDVARAFDEVVAAGAGAPASPLLVV